MRGVDDDTGEYLGPSRKQQRREALEVLALCEQLIALPDGQLAKLPIPDNLLPHIAEARRITSHIARKRQQAFLAKQMRREDDDTLHAIRDALDIGGEAARVDTARLHRAEQWRVRLLEEGDVALAALLDDYPQADRQHLRQLVRNTLAERAKNKPPTNFRELFRALRDILAGEGAAERQDDTGTDTDDSAPADDAAR
ncbi:MULTISPECIES: ribosome biogenesis factor YjgA [Luteimonas]|uniref:ribosome biogenesis factor YjgA n=1 Tax=Luteimonas TaxID=83614 RepID=UPI000C797004|nr:MULTISPECIES: ribosome biogenesis factor YjgA [Luteimonas]